MQPVFNFFAKKFKKLIIFLGQYVVYFLSVNIDKGSI